MGVVAGAGVDRRAVVLHDDAPIGLLLIADLDPIHFQVNVEEAAGHRQRRPPLPRAGLGRQRLGVGFLIVEGYAIVPAG